MNSLTPRILLISVVLLTALNLLLIGTIWLSPDRVRPEPREEETGYFSGREFMPPREGAMPHRPEGAPSTPGMPFRDRDSLTERRAEFQRRMESPYGERPSLSADNLQLTIEQRQQFGKIRREHMQRARELQQKINDLRRTLMSMGLQHVSEESEVAGSAAERVIRSQEYRELEQVLVQLEKENLDYILRLRSLLTPEQAELFDKQMPRLFLGR